MKKILVTGGAGYVGSICVEKLLDEGYLVTVFDNLSEGHRDAVDTRAELIIGDLQNREGVSKTIRKVGPDAVMHFAANALVGESMENPSKYFNNNVVGGLNLLDAIIENKVTKFIFSSTCATFGLPEKVPIDETVPQDPVNPYGESKLLFEKILKWYGQIYGLNFVSLRYFNAAGATDKYGEDHGTETHLIPNILKVALGQKTQLDIFGTNYDTPDGTCIRDYIHVLDLAQAHLLALKSERSAFYNLGTGGGTSVREVIGMAEKVTGKKIPVAERPPRPGDPPKLIASSERIRKELGWNPKYQNIEKIIESAWNWHKNHPNGYAK